MSTWHTLVEAPALAARLGAPSLVVFDCRHDLAKPGYGRDAFASGRIPYARFLHLDDDLSGPKTGRNGRHPLPSAEDFVALMRSHGVSETTQVVAYDDAGGMYAARLWWMLRWVGHDAVAVLDGGFAAWRDAALPISTDAPLNLPHGTLSLRPGVASVSADDVLANLASAAFQVVDARAPDRFRGENETLDPVGGHIPGAINRFFRDNLAPDGRFKTPAQLAEEWRSRLGDRPVAQLVCQCGSGVTACHNLLALEVAGLSGARLYPGSWSEWCADPTRPVAQGD
ncbi:sulfurtransferase [Niveibacterium microcysteis]|uniref:Sulfurtransferase n=1 Tax=Niveibacterium microcysteis TaxID=2811415 RepID=A0ABX7MAI6_9RHOO|nr:sulfurtransferase [Niveibacterium microcysteis]QSI78404.1 sulfurtransferase [Niveibacterium microcysteis]